MVTLSSNESQRERISCPEGLPAATKRRVNDHSDQELLREFAKSGSEAAFTALVRRHIDLVYSIALRIVVDPHLAEDVTQAVFVAAARQAPELQECAILSGWLHRTTRNQASMTVRREVRRRARENDLAAMNHEPSEPVPEWNQLAPELDEALGQMTPSDRDAVLLRFFERKTAREIGERLGLTEEAAQKRVARGLEKLREILHRRGVTTTATGLAAAVSLKAVHAAPLGLAGSVVTASLGTAATVLSSAPTLLPFMISTNTKLMLASLVTAGLATALFVQHQTNLQLQEELAGQAHRPPAKVPVPEPTANRADEQAELARLRTEHSELLRLRGEISLLRQKERERPAAVQSSVPTVMTTDDWAKRAAGAISAKIVRR